MQALRNPDPLILAASTWLAAGLVLYGLTPLSLYDVTWGWSPAFWLLAAPAVLLLARRLSLPAALPRRVATSRGATARSVRLHRVAGEAWASSGARGNRQRRAGRHTRRAG